MGKRRGGAAKSGVAQAKDPETSSSPADEVAEPLGVLWTWTPDTQPTPDVEPAPDVELVETPAPPDVEPPPAVEPPPDVEPVETPPASLAERVADVVREVEAASGVVTSTDPSVGVLWTWTPPAAEPVETPDVEPPPDVELVETPATTPDRRWSDVVRRRSRAAERRSNLVDRRSRVDETTAPAPATDRRRSSVFDRRSSKGDRRSTEIEAAVPAESLLAAPEQALDTRLAEATPPAPTLLAPPVLAPAIDDELTTVRAVMTLDPTLVLPPPPLLAPPIYGDSIDDEVWDRVSPVRLPSRRSVRVALGALGIAVCAVLPWVVPQIPDLFAGAVPDQVDTSIISDPPIDPPPTAPPTPNDSLAGKRLASAGTPLEVTVQRLHVHSDVVPISGADGELIPPNDPQILGWWQEGRGVGAATGSAVVTGHTVSKGGGAFDHLGELVPGDQITVRTKAGTIEYVVRESHDVSVGELARTSASIFRQDGPGRLVLITCSDFNGTVYLSNAIVYASPIADRPLQRR